MFIPEVEFGGVLFKVWVDFSHERADPSVGIDENIYIEEISLIGYYTFDEKGKIVGYTNFPKPIDGDISKLTDNEYEYLMKVIFKHLREEFA